MDIKAFKYKMNDYQLAVLSDNVILFKLKRGCWEVYEGETSTIYEDLESAIGHVFINGGTVLDLINDLDDILPSLDGGRGANGVNYHRWIGSNDDVNHNDIIDLPARINNRIKVKTQEGAISAFRQLYDNADKESAITIDRQGFVKGYKHGVEGSVRPVLPRKGDMVIHNHPNNSTFSPTDMLYIAGTRGNSIVATHRGGYRILTKGTHFNTVEFTKAVKNAKRRGLRGKDINDAVDKFLTRNQKNFGYVFKHVKD